MELNARMGDSLPVIGLGPVCRVSLSGFLIRQLLPNRLLNPSVLEV